jgi:DNA-binding HxlR family transcriptional regulator
VRRTDLSHNVCPVARSLSVVGDWWSLLVVRDALRGVRRFGEFQTSLGLAKNILAARLRAMVEAGILELQPASDGSAYQEYVLTEKGRSLRPVVEALAAWGNVHCAAPVASATAKTAKRGAAAASAKAPKQRRAASKRG